jgi:ElaA protein
MLNDENISLNFETNIIHWSCKPIRELSEDEITSILKIRSKIFTKKCLEKSERMTNVDYNSLHFVAFQNDRLIAYSRLVISDSENRGLTVERFCVEETSRGQGISKLLMEFIINESAKIYPKEQLNLSSLEETKSFYEGFGFNSYDNVIEEDGLEHFYMIKD